MSSHTLIHRTELLADTSDEEYIDWGPELPEGYAGARVRVLVVSPTLLRVTWELERDGLAGWRVEAVDGSGGPLASLAIEAQGDECWVQVPARTHGRVRLFALSSDGAQLVSELSFQTPPDGPAEVGSGGAAERWARLGESGGLVDAAPVAGRGVSELIGPSGLNDIGRS